MLVAYDDGERVLDLYIDADDKIADVLNWKFRRVLFRNFDLQSRTCLDYLLNKTRIFGGVFDWQSFAGA